MREKILDARGLMCPEPIAKARLELKEMPTGSELTILATDPASPIDFEAFCRQKGHTYLACTDREQWLEIRLRKA